jgi:penicillin-binding protein 1C
LYAGLGRGGTVLPLRETIRAAGTPLPARLLDPVASWYIANVLVGTPPPDNAPAGRIAFKTGTSYGYRDAWALGFDGKRTVGVWVGRPDGTPVAGLTGRSTAAPILFDAFARGGRILVALPPSPNGVIVAAAAKLPLPLQRFRASGLPSEAAEPPVRITFPPNGAQLELAAAASGQPDSVAVKLAGGVQPFTVLVNGIPLARQPGRRTLFFQPDGPGFVRLTVMDAKGMADSVVVRVQ